MGGNRRLNKEIKKHKLYVKEKGHGPQKERTIVVATMAVSKTEKRGEIEKKSALYFF